MTIFVNFFEIVLWEDVDLQCHGILRRKLLSKLDSATARKNAKHEQNRWEAQGAAYADYSKGQPDHSRCDQVC